MAEEKIINIVDDESEGFVSAGLNDGVMGGEALYEVTSLSRYFLRSFPKELQYYSSLQELAEADFFTENTEEAQAARQRRQRLYRSLLLTAGHYRPSPCQPPLSLRAPALLRQPGNRQPPRAGL